MSHRQANEQREEITMPDTIPSGLILRCKLDGHRGSITHFTWSPDGKVLASGSVDRTIRLWDAQTGQELRSLSGHSSSISSIAWSPDGKVLASSSYTSTDERIILWDAQTGQELRTLTGHSSWINTIAWSPDGKVLASGSADKTIILWNAQTGQKLQTLIGHAHFVNTIAWSPDGKVLASGSADKTIRLWNYNTGQEIGILEGHITAILQVSFSHDGRLLGSQTSGEVVRLWYTETLRPVMLPDQTFSSDSVIQEEDSDSDELDNQQVLPISEPLYIQEVLPTFEALYMQQENPFPGDTEFQGENPVLGDLDNQQIFLALDSSEIQEGPTFEDWDDNAYISAEGLAFHPNAPVLATLGEEDSTICIWDIDLAILLETALITSSVHYTTAKIALVGDSSVGKSALGYRIVEDRFQVTESTHGQQFWVVDKLGKTRNDGTKCEAILWDFAGQASFRPIHALFLDDIDLALVLFDPARQDTFKGVDYWLKQLSYKGKLCKAVLIAARNDVSTLSTSLAEIETFCRERKISGGFIATSAKTNEGIDTLLETIRLQIDWDTKPATITTETFKRIKDYVLSLKADAKRKNVLVNPEHLGGLLKATDQDLHFNNAEMMTAVEHLQNHGYVSILRRSSIEQSILLSPDLLINLAASYILKAQSNEKGLGTLEESRALRNEYRFAEVENLESDERMTLLNTVTELFLNRNICFRESIDNQTFLIFPSLILERPPRMIEDSQLVDDVTYIVSGLVENIYPALVVLLGYAPNFQRINQWRKQAQYENVRGNICGFKLANDDPSILELVLYYGKDTPNFVRSRFQGLFEEILYTHKVTVRKYPTIFCPKCGRQQERHIVIRRVQESKTFLFCDEDGEKMNLPDSNERILLSQESYAEVNRNQIMSYMRTTYETALVRVKGFIRDRNITDKPTCFLSYAWGASAHERWVLKLADDLRKADIDVLLDQWNNSTIGASVPRFASRIEQSDFIIVVGTPYYREKYENKLSQYGSMVAAEVDLINVRLTGTEAQKTSILPILLSGEERTSFPPLLHRRLYGDFIREEHYFVSLFDLVLTIHRIPFDDPIVADLRAKLREEVNTIISRH